MKHLAPLLVFLAACGGDDGVCQDPSLPHCGLQGHTVVKWQFDHYPEWSFPFDSCTDFQVNKVHVDAVGPTGMVTSKSDDCGAGQVTFDGLTEGDYTMLVAPTDFSNADLVSTPASGPIAAGTFGNDTMTTIYVPYTSWINGPTYTGTFLFSITWGGMECAMAATPVVTQVVTLTIGGVPVAAVADNGQRLDGTDPKPCYSTTTTGFPQSATMLPFGPAQLTIVGKDAADATIYTKTFDTFIGAGITNPTLTFDVPHV